MQRRAALQTLAATFFDVVVLGGGATGLGVALDAALRGHRVALLERGDFAQGTSSRSTKLVHGGVRYFAQGNLRLVYQALHERANLLANAPHLAQPLQFVMPAYRAWQKPLYGLGLHAYDLLAGGARLGRTRWLDAQGVQRHLPTVRTAGLRGGVSYWDGVFDDARLAVALARTAHLHGATVLNYCTATGLARNAGRIAGVWAEERESGEKIFVRTNTVINATGVWAQQLPGAGASLDMTQSPSHPVLVPSQGVHLSFSRALLPGNSALFWPGTSDARVLFAIPWLGKTIVGTTDTRRDVPLEEPRPLPGEVDYLLRECAHLFATPVRREDVLSAWAGLRPLVHPARPSNAQQTHSFSREHLILLRPEGLVSVVGGKWTTYRAMAQEVLDRCERAGLLARRAACITARTQLAGAMQRATHACITHSPGLHAYGAQANEVGKLPGAQCDIAPGLSEAMVRHAVRFEFARTVEDVLARRSRLLFLDARTALSAAPGVAAIMQQETAAAVRVEEFKHLARQYLDLGP